MIAEWFSISSTSEILTTSFGTLVGRLVMAWGAGCIVAELALRSHPRQPEDTLPTTLILMAVLIAMATQIIGDNVARAFSLVGALSIVRFRIAVPSSRDIAFVLASVVIGMAIGAGQWSIGVAGLVVVGIATEIGNPWLRLGRFNPFAAPGVARITEPEGAHRANVSTGTAQMPDDKSWKLTIQTGLAAGDQPSLVLAELTNACRLLSYATIRRGSSLELCYLVQLRDDATIATTMKRLQELANIESVRWDNPDE